MAFTLTNGQTSEWMSSLDIAKRLALAQNKMLFVMWEDAAIDFEMPIIESNNKTVKWISILDYDRINEEIWKHFVPVVLSESLHQSMLDEIKKKRKPSYISKFNDDGIKIMDVNGNILNTSSFSGEVHGGILESILERYAIKTNYIDKELSDYFKKRNFITAFRLAAKYMDFAILNNKILEKEIIELSMLYLDEARALLLSEPLENKEGFRQKCDLLEWFQFVIKNKPKKALRYLGRLEASNVNSINDKFFALLYYTSFKLLKDEKEASLWKTKVSLVDLKKAEMILNKNR